MAVRELDPAYRDAPEPLLTGSGHGIAPGAGRRWLARLDQPFVPGVLALLGAAGFVLARWQRWSRGDIGSWILVGRRFAPDRMWLAPGVGIRPGTGYDGQFYYRLALNPADLSHTAYGITLDAPYRLMRIGYPALTWIASAGQAALVPVMLVAVNVAALACMGWSGGVFARQGGHHAAWGLLLPAYSGLLTSVSRDTAEPVACALMLGGLLAVRSRRWALAGVLLAFGVLTRETVMVAVAAVAVVRIVVLCRRPGLRRGLRPGSPDLAWVLPAGMFLAWELVVRLVTGSFPMDADGDRNAGTPVVAAYDAIRDNLRNLSWSQFSWTDIWLLEFAVLLVVAGMALACLRRSRVPGHERVALIGFLIEICVVTPTTWNSLNADLRSFVEVYLLAVIVLLGMPRVRLRQPAAWLLPVAAAWAVPALIVVGGRRVFWS